MPLADGSTPNEHTPPAAARRKRILNALNTASIASGTALWCINAGMAQANFRRPAKRRVLKRSW